MRKLLFGMLYCCLPGFLTIVVAQEPDQTEELIQTAMDHLTHGRTSFVIAHRLSTIKNADEIVVINHEGLQERGTHDELMKKGGTYARYYNLQFEGME